MFADWANLRQHLKACVRDALTLLEQFQQLPRPPLTPLELWGNPLLLDELHKTSSYSQLDTYLRDSGLQQILRCVGHTWFWHHEVFPELFVELLVSRARGSIPATKDFDRLFAAAQRELCRSRSHLRLVVVVYGLPASHHGVRLNGAARLVPVDMGNSPYELYRHLALDWQRGDTERDVFNGHLLVVDELAERAGDNTQAIATLKQMQRTAARVVLAARLGLGHVVTADTYFCHVSAFPLFPLIHWPNPDLRGGRVETLREWTPAQSRRLRQLWRLVQTIKDQESGSLRTALERFNVAHRFRENTSNLVDLIVALESVTGVQKEELARRLGLRVALLAGRTDRDRDRIYRLVGTAYKIRNHLVHGGRKPEGKIRTLLRHYYTGFAKLHPPEDLEVDLAGIAHELQRVTASSILARLKCELGDAKWPADQDWDAALLSKRALRDLQAAVGLRR